jgi:diaminopimelate epimerase
MTGIPFTKMHSASNDFVLINNFTAVLAGINSHELAKKICDRRIGVGSDGLLILEPDPESHFFMRFINPDGTEAFCGNGSLCSAHFGHKQNIAPAEVKFRSPWGIHRATVSNDTVELAMVEPKDWKLNLKIDGDTGHLINTGAPHTVVFLDDVIHADMTELGIRIRFHPLFAPAGTNVDLAQVVSRSKLLVRTYERGVENETLSCGSGATAAACIGYLVKGMKPPVTCSFKGGDLWIDFKFANGAFHDVLLKNRVKTVFEGVYHLTIEVRTIQ